MWRQRPWARPRSPTTRELDALSADYVRSLSDEWEQAARNLAGRFRKNFESYAKDAGTDILDAGPAAL